MTRETRANLIFIVIFVVVAIPGAVILFRKKLDPTERQMGQPYPVLKHMVFIDPTDAPPSIPRIMPTVTAAWLADLVRQRIGPFNLELRPDSDGTQKPIMSEQRLAQLVHLHQSHEGLRVGLIVWNVPRGAMKIDLHLQATQGATQVNVTDATFEQLKVPEHVKQDLQATGYPIPPQQVVWSSATIKAAPAAGIDLQIRCTVDDTVLTDTLTLPHP